MSRLWSMLVAGGLLMALCGCPGETPEKDGGKKPSPSQPESKPSEVESAGSDGGAVKSGKAVAFGVGVNSNRDPAVAARQAAGDALDQLGIPPKGIVFCVYCAEKTTTSTTDEHGFDVEVEHQRPDPEKERMALAAIRETAGPVPMIGCRARAVIRDASSTDDTVAVLAIGGDDVSCRAVKAELVDDRKDVGAALAKGLGDVDDLRFAVVFAGLDLAYNQKPGVSADEFAGGVVSAVGEGPVLFGGLAMPCEDIDAGRDGVFLGDQAVDHTVVALGVGGPILVHAAVGHEFQPAEPACKVTKSDSKWIEQLDGRPAAAVYREIRGMEPDDEFTRDWQHPIDVMAGPEEFCLRMVLDEDKPRGALRLITPVDEGTEIEVLYGGGNAEAILESAQGATKQSLDKAGDSKPLALLLADADARGRRLEQFPGPDGGVVEKAVLPAIQKCPDLPIFGFRTFGEFGPGARLHQQAVVSVVLCEEE